MNPTIIHSTDCYFLLVFRHNASFTMSDSSGLVQRRRVVPKPDEDENNRDASGERNEDDDAGMDHDSKETRLTLMEEVLLLGLKDKG